MNELPVQIEFLSKKYSKKLERIIVERSEKQVQKHKAWLKKRLGGVGVIAEKNGKFVLVRHTPEYWGNFHNYWAFPGGAVEHREDFEEAAVREFKEETGLKVKISNLISIHEHIIRSPQGNQSVFYVATFEGKVVGGKMKPENPNEISEVKLFDKVPERGLAPWLQDPSYHRLL